MEEITRGQFDASYVRVDRAYFSGLYDGRPNVWCWLNTPTK